MCSPSGYCAKKGVNVTTLGLGALEPENEACRTQVLVVRNRTVFPIFSLAPREQTGGISQQAASRAYTSFFILATVRATGMYFDWTADVGSLFLIPFLPSQRVRIAPTIPYCILLLLLRSRLERRVASKYAGDTITLVPWQRRRPRSQFEHYDGDDPDRAHRRYDVGASPEMISLWV